MARLFWFITFQGYQIWLKSPRDWLEKLSWLDKILFHLVTSAYFSQYSRYGSGFGGYEFSLLSSTTFIYKSCVLVLEVCSKLSKFLKAFSWSKELGFWTSKEYILPISWYFWVIAKTSFSSKGYKQITSKVSRSCHEEET